MRKFLLSLLVGIVLSNGVLFAEITPNKSSILGVNSSKKRPIKILSIDGGGIRGIIPALILQNIESRLKHKKHLAHCFDVMSGTSTGGVIVLLLNMPDMEGNPRYKTCDLVAFYRNLGGSIFNQSWGQYLMSCNGWINEKYSTNNLEKHLLKNFGDCKLSDSVTHVIIPAYEINDDDTVFFKSDKAKVDVSRDFYYVDVAKATSAAPTFFKPAQIQDVSKRRTYTLVDGGVAANNPTMSACVHALKLFGKNKEFLVISIGTGSSEGAKPAKVAKDPRNGGKLDWASEIVNVMMHASSDVIDYQMAEIFIKENGKKKYYRFQAFLDPKHISMDDASPENLQALEKYAYDLIEENEEQLKKVAALVDQD